MRKWATCLAAAALATTIAGCDGGGIEEGASTEEAAPTGAPPGFADMMKKQGEMMKMKSQQRKPTPKAVLDSPPEETK